MFSRSIKSYSKILTFKVTIVTSATRLFAGSGSWVSDKVTEVLKLKKIKLVLETKIVKIQDENVITQSEQSIPYDLLIWSTGAAPHKLLQDINVEKNENGWISVKPTLQSISSPYFFAVN